MATIPVSPNNIIGPGTNGLVVFSNNDQPILLSAGNTFSIPLNFTFDVQDTTYNAIIIPQSAGIAGNPSIRIVSVLTDTQFNPVTVMVINSGTLNWTLPPKTVMGVLRVVNAALDGSGGGNVIVGNYMPIAGGEFTGPVSLAGDATGPLEPVTLQQLEAYAPGGNSQAPDLTGYAKLSGAAFTGQVTVQPATDPTSPVTLKQMTEQIPSTAGLAELAGAAFTGPVTVLTATAPSQPVTLAQMTAAIPNTSALMPTAGGTFTGAVTLAGDANNPLQPTTLQQVTASENAKVSKSGDTMTGVLTIDKTLGSQSGISSYAVNATDKYDGNVTIRAYNSNISNNSASALNLSTGTANSYLLLSLRDLNGSPDVLLSSGAGVVGSIKFRVPSYTFQNQAGTVTYASIGAAGSGSGVTLMGPGSAPNDAVTVTQLKNATSGITITPYSSTITPDFSNSTTIQITLTGNATIQNPANLVAGRIYTILIIQDATGNRTVTWGTGFKFGTGRPALSASGNSIDMIQYCAIDANTLANIAFSKTIGAY